MIIFVPAYDDVTRGNLAVASAMLVDDEDERLFENHATVQLLDRLRSCPGRPLFAMSHGCPDYLCGQGGIPVLNLDVIVEPALGARIMFVYACHTATELGRVAARNGAIWLGYTGEISAPPSTPATLSLFASLFDFVRATFPRLRDVGLRQALFHELERRCDEAAAQLDELAERGVLVEMDAHLCLLHLWQRLRIWVDGELPEQHPRSPPPSLF